MPLELEGTLQGDILLLEDKDGVFILAVYASFVVLFASLHLLSEGIE